MAKGQRDLAINHTSFFNLNQLSYNISYQWLYMFTHSSLTTDSSSSLYNRSIPTTSLLNFPNILTTCLRYKLPKPTVTALQRADTETRCTYAIG